MTEFGFIEKIRDMFASIPAGDFEGIGDDCAVLPINDDEALLFTADALCEGVHFLCDATTAFEIGAKSAAVNLSDIAAMGARPIATLLSLSLPQNAIGEWAEEFMRGYRSVSERYGVTLAGGDTTCSKSEIYISVTAIGRAKLSHIKRRSAAQVGDTIMVGGTLGESAIGLRDILAGNYSTAAAHTHRNPTAQILEGEWLGQQECVHAMMDLSDGLASDLQHILDLSHVGAIIDTERIPAADTDTRNAVCGGEDYKLLFTVEADAAEALACRFKEQFGYDIHAIGTITANALHSIVWHENGEPVTHDDWGGFLHF
ncbi:MAG: thiamine-phosphate kinase [Alistipes sp.]|nr:thiamine-phosphate kinase [Alistipes sp.]